ncbi:MULTISPECIES: nitroreductase [unclassified Delftia]|uniref:nitroreductase n=1 Tax=unclassified Delftia TaxID=2613839 RepID=UPI0018FF23E7|nr:MULTISPECIES: nitroreductase family protein [unclassified Delftia]MBK0113421.1 nitroreductase family protein [Delftia sp. S65]MBK0118990.1 nitroreductase family protein [Delftia sp. S67]MBK0130835.1 nitroreductase family protein [Delftia sp. S66]
MTQKYIPHLLALDRERDWARAAQACGISDNALAQAIRSAEAEFGHALVRAGRPFQGFTLEGEQVLAWARQFAQAVDALKHCFADTRKRAGLAPLLARRSVSPRRLAMPGPDSGDMDLMIEAALCAPDHGALHPWRVLEFPAHQREALASLFEQEKRRRDPLAPADDIPRAREHATRAPALIAFIISPRPRSRVPVREQWLAAGGALGNFLNAAHHLGFGAIVLSGERCFDPALQSALGLREGEHLAGFISLGTITSQPSPRATVAPSSMRTAWQAEQTAAVTAQALLQPDGNHDSHGSDL